VLLECDKSCKIRGSSTFNNAFQYPWKKPSGIGSAFLLDSSYRLSGVLTVLSVDICFVRYAFSYPCSACASITSAYIALAYSAHRLWRLAVPNISLSHTLSLTLIAPACILSLPLTYLTLLCTNPSRRQSFFLTPSKRCVLQEMYGSRNPSLYPQDPVAINEQSATRNKSTTIPHRAKHDKNSTASTPYSAGDSHRQIPRSAVDLG
jgi:hypothetical protein